MDVRTQFINSVNLNAASEFPYLVLNVIDEHSYPLNPGFRVMHWHTDLQFIYVLDGEIEIKTLDTVVRVGAESGVFINQNVVHLVRTNGPSHYNSFLFPAYFLAFYPGSPASSFVKSVVGNERLPLYCFLKENETDAPILAALQNLCALEKNKTNLYVYEVLVTLATLWLEVQRNLSFPAQPRAAAPYARMRTFLQYIERHYGENISLQALAASANVSISECLRCFHVTMQTTPHKYLMEYRLSKAADLLRQTDEAIGCIAERVGFHHNSHFGKCFKEKTGMSPREYRKLR